MQVSTTLILILQDIMVVCILNLSGFFLKELGTQLLFETIHVGIAVYYSIGLRQCMSWGHSYCLKLSTVE